MSQPNHIINCSTCLWFEIVDSDFSQGECHRYAPKPLVFSMPKSMPKEQEKALETLTAVVWPQVFLEDRCGDYMWEGGE